MALIVLALLASVVAASYCGDAPLKLHPFNAGPNAFFPVASVLVAGEKDAILIDAQFEKSRADAVVQLVRATGKRLTTVYVSHGDPDYYFGLETIHAAFPDAAIVATAPTVDHIKETAAGKLAFWGPLLGADAPTRTILPAVLATNSLSLEGRTLAIHGYNGSLNRSYVWIEDLGAVVGGVLLDPNLHVFLADTQTLQSHADWLATLDQIQALNPKVIVPGHGVAGAVADIDAPAYTAKYIRDFDDETPKAATGDALMAAMIKLYPNAGSLLSLNISAHVAKGEMKWP